MDDALILRAITFYQRHISPRKGWRCAYSVLHGGAGCSGAIGSAIQTHGWRAARPLARRRFRECKLAAQMLRAQNGSDETQKPARRRRKQRGWASDCCNFDPCFCLNLTFDCGPGDIGCIDCTPCDCTPCN